MGVATSTFKVQAGNSEALAATGTYPELKPTAFVVALVRSEQGVPKADCVTVWFLAWNSKVTVSPTTAEMLEGVKTKPEVPPTIILWSSALTRATEAIRRVASENNIL